MTASEPHPQTGQPIGLPVTDPTPAPPPGPVTLKGRYGRLEKLTAEHAAELGNAHGPHLNPTQFADGNEPGLMRALRRVSNGLTNSAHSNHVPGHSTHGGVAGPDS